MTTTPTTTIRVSEKLKTELSSMGSKEDTYEDIIQRNIQFTKKFSNEKQFAEWFEVNFRLLGFDQIIEKPSKCPDYIMLKDMSRVRVELETMSGNFILHRHNPKDVDLVICLLKNKELPVKILELNVFDYIPPTPPERNKTRVNLDIPDELYYKLKEYNRTHRDRPINMGGVVQECLEKIFKEDAKPITVDKIPIEFEIINNDTPTPEASLEAMRNKWWIDKHIGRSIVNAGGIGLINLTNIIQKNPDLFETKEECRAWLHDKLKPEPPVIEEIPLISNKQRKLTAPNTAENPPKFTPNRTTFKCPGCGEEQLIILGSPVKRCVNCGHPGGQENSTKPQSDQHDQHDQQAQAQNNPPPPPTESP